MLLGRARRGAGRVRPQVSTGAGQRPRARHRHRPRDGVRVRHGRERSRRAPCAPTTTRCPRRRSGCATREQARICRRGLHRRDRAAARSTATRSSASRSRCWIARRSTGARSSVAASTCRPARTPARPSAWPRCVLRHRRIQAALGGRGRGAGPRSSASAVLAERGDLGLLGVDRGLGVADGLRLGREGVGRQRTGLGGVERLAPVGCERVVELRPRASSARASAADPWRAPGPSRARRSRAPCPSRARL